MLSIEQVVFLITLILARAEEQKLESCDEHKYHIRTDSGGFEEYFGSQNNTWEEVITAVPTLNSTETACSVLRDGVLTTLSGKLVGIQLDIWEYKDDKENPLKNILALSKDLQFMYVILVVLNPVVLEESMFFSNKQLEYIRIEMHIQEIVTNTFLHLEKLELLSLSGCRLTNFNPNELPSSLERLYLEDNRLQTFDLTKPLMNLITLDLSENFLTKFILDLKDLLPIIKTVSLEKNKITDFQPIDNNLNHTLKKLNLDNNQIRNFKAYEWILHNRNVTSVSCKGNIPVCDCSSKETLNELANKTIVDTCILPVPGEVQVNITWFECPPESPRDNYCPHFSDGFFSEPLYRGVAPYLSTLSTTVVANCSKALLPFTDVIYYGNSAYGFENYHFYLSGNSDVTVLPALNEGLDKRTKIHIYAENCNLRSPIFAEKIPKKLRHLYMANNSIDEIDVEVLEELSEMETHLTLANNPIVCDCQHKPMYDQLVQMHHLIDDFNQLTCNDGLPFATDRVLCITWDMYLLYFVLALLAVLTCFLFIFLRYTLEIQVYIYSRGWFPSYFRTEVDETNYKYDVFLSYSDKDEDFVLSIIDFLENEISPPFKVCHHHRDWVVGERIDVQINTSVEQSRKTVIILSPNFLTSVWINIEFRTALYTMLEEKAPKLVLIIHGDIGPIKELKPEMRTYIKTTTYLASDNKWFWKKLAYSLRRPINKEVIGPAQQDIEMTPQH